MVHYLAKSHISAVIKEKHRQNKLREQSSSVFKNLANFRKHIGNQTGSEGLTRGKSIKGRRVRHGGK